MLICTCYHHSTNCTFTYPASKMWQNLPLLRWFNIARRLINVMKDFASWVNAKNIPLYAFWDIKIIKNHSFVCFIKKLNILPNLNINGLYFHRKCKIFLRICLDNILKCRLLFFDVPEMCRCVLSDLVNSPDCVANFSARSARKFIIFALRTLFINRNAKKSNVFGKFLAVWALF